MFIGSRSYFLAFVFLLVGAACKKELRTPAQRSTATISSFSFRAEKNPAVIQSDLVATISDSIIYVHIPYLADVDSLVPTFTTDAAGVSINNIRQVSDSSHNDYRHKLTYTLTAEDGSLHEYRISVKQYTDLPIIRVQTDNSAPVNSTEIYVGATISISSNGTDLPDFSGKTEIRGRGNSTWTIMPKKPYRLKLDKKSEILGMPTNKHWVLLANYADKSLMRTKIAFTMGEWFGMTYSPRGQFAELFLNNQYQGSYFLTEQVKPDPNRVNITEMTAADETPETITGGYLLELDKRLDAEHWWKTTKDVSVTLKEPEVISATQLAYITRYVQDMENAIYAADFTNPATGYKKYINDETFVQWYWVNEIFRNEDANFYSSVFLYKDRNAKLSIGPIWDFDIAAGNINYNESFQTTGWHVRNTVWFARLFEDPVFKKNVKDKYYAVKPKLAGLMNLIDSTASELRYSQVENFKKWDILNTWVWPNYAVQGSYVNEVNYLKTWLTTRMAWIESQLLMEP
ncbi:MAG: CotH kinase family protein [Chitinophagaceae bacterium]